MAIYIKGVEMPKHCIDCPFMVSRDNDDCVLQSDEANEKFDSWDDMKSSCPLIEVKEPRGKLVDSDMLYASIAKDTYLLTDESDSRDYGMFLIDIRKKVDKATTVIEKNK